MQKTQKRQRDDMQREEEPEYLGPKCNLVLGGSKRASDRVNRQCDERLLEAGRLDVVTPGLAANEERLGAGRLILWVTQSSCSVCMEWERQKRVGGEDAGDL